MTRPRNPRKPRGVGSTTPQPRGRRPGFAPQYSPQQTQRYKSQALRYSKAVELANGGPDFVEWEGDVLSGDGAELLRNKGNRAFEVSDRLLFKYSSDRAPKDYWTVTAQGKKLKLDGAVEVSGSPPASASWAFVHPNFTFTASGVHDATPEVPGVKSFTGTVTVTGDPPAVGTWSYAKPTFNWSASGIHKATPAVPGGLAAALTTLPNPSCSPGPLSGSPQLRGLTYQDYYTVNGLNTADPSVVTPDLVTGASLDVGGTTYIGVNWSGAPSGTGGSTSYDRALINRLYARDRLPNPPFTGTQTDLAGFYVPSDHVDQPALYWVYITHSVRYTYYADFAYGPDPDPSGSPCTNTPYFPPLGPTIAVPAIPEALAGGVWQSNIFTLTAPLSVPIAVTYNLVDGGMVAPTGAISVQLYTDTNVLVQTISVSPTAPGAGSFSGSFAESANQAYYIKITIPPSVHCDAATVTITDNSAPAIAEALAGGEWSSNKLTFPEPQAVTLTADYGIEFESVTASSLVWNYNGAAAGSLSLPGGAAGLKHATVLLTLPQDVEVQFFLHLLLATHLNAAALVLDVGTGELVLKCDCPDFTRSQPSFYNSPYNSEQVTRDWSDSDAGCDQEQGCKHVIATKLFLGVPQAVPTDYP